MRRLLSRSLWLTLFVAVPAGADIPVGETINKALVVDVTPEGFDSISDTLPELLPSEIEVPDIRQTGSAGFDWEANATNIDVGVEVVDVAITPSTGYLDVSATVDLLANSEANPAGIKFVYKTPRWLGGPWTLADCDFWLRPVTVDINTKVYMTVIDDGNGNRVLDATLTRVDWGWSFTGTDLQVDDCWIGAINDILEYVDFSLFDLVKGPIEGLIDDQIQALIVDLEPTLEDAFNSVQLDETLAFNGADIHVKVEPYDVDIRPAGLRLITSGLAEAEEAPCVAGSAFQASYETPSELPQLGDQPAGIGAYGVGFAGSDEFINQFLFSAYRGGALCFDLSGSQGELPINTGLLSLLAPGAFDEVFDETQPMVIELRPGAPPVARADGPYDISVDAKDLALDMYAELDGRQALVVGIDLDIETGADLEFDGDTGLLEVVVDLTGDDLQATVRPNELVPGQEEAIASQVGTLFDTLAGPIIGDALSGLSFPIPAFGTVGLQSLDAAPTGPERDHFGFFANAGPVPYATGGCADGGGCGDGGSEGCDSGCGPGGVASGRGLTLVLLPLLVAGLRRRRR